MSADRVKLRRVLAVLDSISNWSARLVCMVTLIMMAVLLREIVGRYFFNAPSGWANEVNEYLLCFLTMLGGGYCVLTDAHIRVDILWQRFGFKTQSAVELATAIFPIAFLGIITWIGSVDSFEALVENKRSMSIMAMPLWPSMLAVPLGT
jgi:TRAP-type C4-dicarboxylate transport system permease small subunit